MKTTNRKALLIAGLCSLTLFLGTAVYAEKGAENLARQNRVATPANVQPAAAMSHACARCSDQLAVIADPGAKGSQPAVRKVMRHGCSSCSTQIVTQGDGKARVNVALHSCGADTKPACCARN